MTDQLQRDINRGKQAEILLQNELVQEAFKALEDEYFKLWQATKPLDTDVRESLWHSYRTVGEVKTHLHRLVDSGTMAQLELDARK